MKTPTIQDGRAFAIVALLLVYLWLVCTKQEVPKGIETYIGIIMGFLFAQNKKELQ